MRRLIAPMLSGAFGVVVCIGIVMLAQAFRLVPQFPAPGGEDDFAFRAALFFFGLCPAFAVLGVWISALSESKATAAIRIWAGAVLGSFLVLLSTRVLRAKLESLNADGEGNHATIVLFIAWFLAAVAGAWLAGRRQQRRDD